MMPSRRMMLFQMTLAVGAAGLLRFPQAAQTAQAARAGEPAQPINMIMYKTPQCGCCDKWAAHMAAHGFKVRTEERNDLYAIKTQLGVPHDLQSCHTALVGDYVVEGHVPAGDVKRLLRERPEARGIAVPGMPVGSPGMEVGKRQDAYAVLLFGGKPTPSIFARH